MHPLLRIQLYDQIIVIEKLLEPSCAFPVECGQAVE